MTIQSRTLILTLLLFLMLSPPAAIQAGAATLTVSHCGDTGTQGQLRQVIAAANAGDTINVPACTITLTNPADPLTVNKSLTINGAGAGRTVIDGGNITGILLIFGAAPSVTLTGVTLQHGNGAGLNPFAGAVQLANGSSLTLSSSAVTANHGVMGGGLLVAALTTLTVTDSVVSGNQSACTGGVHNEGTLIMARSTVTGNRSTGACNVGGVSARGPTTLINTTVSGNDGGPAAGGIEVADGATLTVTSGTITENTGFAAVAIETGTSVTMSNTIVANNGGTNCGGGAVTSGGHNLDSENSCDFTAVGDLINTDPQLLPLANYGGPTRTHALLRTSPAIDAGDAASCPATDQRGVPRPLDATSPGFVVCDIGAFEVETLAFIQASLSLNTASVRPGTPFQGTVTVTNAGGARPLDAYVVFVPPPAAGPAFGCAAGDALIFLTGSGAVITCVSSGVQTFAPFVGDVSLPGQLFAPVSGPVFSFVWPSGVPAGAWTVALVLTPVGAFADGRVDPTGDIVIAPAGFSVSP